MNLKRIILISTFVTFTCYVGVGNSNLKALSLVDLSLTTDTTFNKTLSYDQDLPKNTIIHSTEEFKQAMEHAMATLQTDISLKVASSNLDDYSHILDQYNGLTSYSLKCLSKGPNNYLEITLVYKQAFKLTQALHNDLASSKLSKDDLALLETAKQIIAKITNANMTAYQKELAIHDYIITTTSYDYDNLKAHTIPARSYTAAGVLINKVAVCQGYSEAFKLLLNLCGIECEIVTGTSNGIDHAWNVVKLDNEWYIVDVTYDDPITYDNNKRIEVLQYDYFNITNKQLSVDHIWDTWKYPVATASKYNYFVYNGILAHNFTEFKKIILSQVKEGKKELLCYVENYNPNDYDLSFLFEYASSIYYTLPSDGDTQGSITITLS